MCRCAVLERDDRPRAVICDQVCCGWCNRRRPIQMKRGGSHHRGMEPDDVFPMFDFRGLCAVCDNVMRFEVTVDDGVGVLRVSFVHVGRRDLRCKDPERQHDEYRRRAKD